MLRYLLPIMLVAITVGSCCAQEATEPVNLALGKIVSYAPAPSYRLTVRDDTDVTDLTDGQLTTRDDAKIWFDRTCVGWSYAGRCNLSVDLEAVQPISEVSIRMLGGGRLPLWAELLVSDDGDRYYKIAEYSVFAPGDREKFGIPRHQDESFIFPLTFSSLQTRGRYVGLRMYMTGLSCAEELYVRSGSHDPDSVSFSSEQLTDFTVTGAAAYFHKPVLYFSTNINTPNPLGIVKSDGLEAAEGTCIIDLPEGLSFVGGSIDGTALADIEAQSIHGYVRYEIPVEIRESGKVFGRVYINGNWPEGKQGAVRYQLKYQGGQSPVIEQPIQAIAIANSPAPKRLMTTLGWWGLSASKVWPEALAAFKTIGFNTASTFARWMDPEDEELWEFRDKVAAEGFKMLNIDSPLHVMMNKHRDSNEWKCQLADGTASTGLCPSYRGEYWQEELQRIAEENARLRPDYWFPDIEVWNWRGPIDAEKCTRCQNDFAESGLATWEEWKLQKGYEMWSEMARTVREAVAAAGGPRVELGVYAWTPQHDYQYTWPAKRMYPEWLDNAQSSTYTPLYPYHIALVGDEARRDALLLGKNDCMPWISPGDAGVFSGESFHRALLEQFFNGARGTNFWSSRVWDADILEGYARAVKVVAPVEDIIVDGRIVADDVNCDSERLRISAIARDKDLIFLLGNYYEDDLGTIQVRLPLESGAYEVIDLASGKIMANLKARPYVLKVDWGTRGVGAFWARPME